MASSELTQAIQAYRTLDPAGWVAIYRVLPTYAALAACLLGSVFLAWGNTRAIRLLTIPLGIVVGAFAIPPFLLMLDIAPPRGPWQWAPSAAFGLLGLISPVALFFFAIGMPVGLVAAELLGRSDAMLGLIGGMAISGAAAALLWRRLAALVSSALGAWLLVLGLLSAVHYILPFLGAQALGHPIAALSVAGVLAVLGTSYQLSRPSSEEAARNRAARKGSKRQNQEQRALEKKWTEGGRRP